jgi:hypothetical protein
MEKGHSFSASYDYANPEDAVINNMGVTTAQHQNSIQEISTMDNQQTCAVLEQNVKG